MIELQCYFKWSIVQMDFKLFPFQIFQNQIRMENQPLKNRLFQNLLKKTAKHANMLDGSKGTLAPILKPKIMQEGAGNQSPKQSPTFKSGRAVLTSIQQPQAQQPRKKPKEVSYQKLSKQARLLLEQGKSKLKSNLNPHDIFNFYENFPEMLEDFFYLNRQSHPYDYQIVNYAHRNHQEYMTISCQGVTLYHDKQAQFLTKKHWLVDQKNYYSLQKIYFFKQYKLCKNFRIWKNRMRRHYLKQMSGVLCEHLFFTLQHPRKCLLKIKQYASSLKENLTFFPYETLERLTPTEFTKKMEDFRQNTLIASVKNTTQAIIQTVSEAVLQEINKFKVQNNIKIEQINQSPQKQSKEGYVYSQQAILRKQYKRIMKLIKLVDHILLETKIDIVKKCLEEVVENIRDMRQGQREPWITCTARIQEGDSNFISWDPKCQEFVDFFLTMIKKNILCLNENNQKIVNNPIFAKYRISTELHESKIDENRASFKGIVESSTFYNPILYEIEDELEKEFKDTLQEQKQLQHFLKIYLRHKDMVSLEDLFKNSNGVDLCNFVDQWKIDEKEMHQFPEFKRGKLFVYNFIELRKKIMDTPKKTLTDFFILFPTQTQEKCRNLIRQCKNHCQELLAYPTQIFSFVKFNKAVKKASDRIDDIKSNGSQICLMIDLMNKNKIGNVEIFNSKKIEVMNVINNLKAKVDEYEAKENQSLSRFKKQNQSEITKIKAQTKQSSGKFFSIDFNQNKVSSKQMKDIISKLNEILPSITTLETQSKMIQQIEIELNIPFTNFAEVHQLYEQAQTVKEIWTCKDEWKAMLVEIYHKHYYKIDVTQLKQQWEKYYNWANNLSKNEPQNQILKSISFEISEVETLIDMIAALRSSTLEQKSWRQISQYLAYELGCENDAELPFSNPHDPKYTLKWMIEVNIPAYKEKIEFIVKKSEKEKELFTYLTQFKNFLSSLTLELIPQKKEREVYILGENKMLKQKLQQKLNYLYSLIDKGYSQNIKLEVEALIKHYEYFQQLLHSAFDYGIFWQKYESFFDSNSPCLKLLTKESKEFLNWQNNWKKIIKNLTSDSVYMYKKICDETLGINCSRSTIKNINKVNSGMEMIKKGLDDYLEKKRISFPRYFFIGDDELLNMFSQIDGKQAITASFVPKLYKNIQEIVIKSDTKDMIQSVISKDKELFELKPVNFKLQSEMEDIFKLTEQQIKKRINYLIKNVFVKYTEEEVSRETTILQNNAQVINAIDYIAWVRLAEETYMCSEPIGDLYDWLVIQNEQIQEVQKLLSVNYQKGHVYHKLVQLMLQSIYFREKTESFLHNNINSTGSFQWSVTPKLKLQLSTTAPQIYLQILSTKMPYGYEFLSNSAYSYTTPQSERIWLNISQAILQNDLILLTGSKTVCQIQTIRELGYVVGQQVEWVDLGSEYCYKVIDRFINGMVFSACWVGFNWSQNYQIMSYLAGQMCQIKKASLEPNNLSKSCSINPSPAMFISMPTSQLPEYYELPLSCKTRTISFNKPNYAKIFSMIATCENKSPQIGEICVKVIEMASEMFGDSMCLEFGIRFIRTIYQKTKEEVEKLSQRLCIQKQEVYYFIVVEIIERQMMRYLSKHDKKIFESFKYAIVPNFDSIKHQIILSKKQSHFIPHLKSYLQSNGPHLLESQDFMSQQTIFLDSIESTNLGIILAGEALSGKSSLISDCSQVYDLAKGQQTKVQRIYHNAYRVEQVFRSGQKEGILNKIEKNWKGENWIVFDGHISQYYSRMYGRKAYKYITPLCTLLEAHSQTKFILEMNDISDLDPSFVANHRIIIMNPDYLTSEALLRKTFTNIRENLSGLQTESLEYFEQHLLININRLESPGNLKSRLIGFIYPLNTRQITMRICRLLESVVKMNGESIKQKDKNMKKIVQKFNAWLIYWSLCGVCKANDTIKLEKYILECCKVESLFNEELESYIVYPGCGLEVQVMTGLRTQSSLGIPESGIITNCMKFQQDSSVEAHSKTSSKFYEEIVISQSQLIRVNTKESNVYNYYAQLSAFTDTPLLLCGPANSGKKTLIELYAKNRKNSCQFYSVRFMQHQSFMLNSQLEKPFRQLNGLNGTLLKSHNINKKVIVCVQDISLTQKSYDSMQLLRMIVNEKGFYNREGNWKKICDNNLLLLSNRIIFDKFSSRLMPKINIFKSSEPNIQKLFGIFSSYMKNWSSFNEISGDVQRIFTSEAGDTMLDATLSIYKLCDQIYRDNCGHGKNSFQNLIMKPRINDISKTLANICKTADPNNYILTYYYEIWTHEIMRVFLDRTSNTAQREAILKEIKKESLVKFKQNFTFTSQKELMFSSLGIENENCYIKIQDVGYLHSFISNIIEAQEISVCLKFLFNELLSQIVKIYRVMSMENGHMMLINLNEKVSQYLIKLASQVSQCQYYNLKGLPISSEKHIQPTVKHKNILYLANSVENLTQQSIYEISCFMNSNFVELNMKQEVKEKLKNIVKKEKNVRAETQKKQTKFSLKKKTEPLKIQSLFKEQEIDIQIIQNFMEYTHFVFLANPTSQKAKRFLQNQVDIVGMLHFNWTDMPEESIVKASHHILNFDEEGEQDMKTHSNDDKIIEKVNKIYLSLAPKDRYFNSFLCICEMVRGEVLEDKKNSQEKIKELEKIKENIIKVKSQIQFKEEESRLLHDDFQASNSKLQKIQIQFENNTNKISDLHIAASDHQNSSDQRINQLKAQQEQFELQIKMLKERKEKLQNEKKKVHKNIKIAKEFIQKFNYETTQIQQLIKKQQKQTLMKEDELILVLSALNMASQASVAQWINLINSWIEIINSNVELLVTEENLLSLIRSVFSIDMAEWNKYTCSSQIQTLAILYLLQNYEQTANCHKFLRIQDKKGIILDILKKITKNSTFKEYNSVYYINKFVRETKFEIQTICKTKNDLIVLELTDKNICELEKHLQNKKMSGYFGRIIAITSTQPDIGFQCSEKQIELCTKELYMSLNKGFLATEKANIYDEIFKNQCKKNMQEKEFYRSCSQVQLETETYSQEITKIKLNIQCINQSLKNNQSALSDSKYLLNQQDLKIIEILGELVLVYNQFQLKDLKQLYDFLKITMVKYGMQDVDKDLLLEQIEDSLSLIVFEKMCFNNFKNWFNTLPIIKVRNTKSSFNYLDQQQYKMINFLNSSLNLHDLNNNVEQTNICVFYNYIHELHSSTLNEVISKCLVDIAEGKKVVIFVMTNSTFTLNNQKVKLMEKCLPKTNDNIEQRDQSLDLSQNNCESVEAQFREFSRKHLKVFNNSESAKLLLEYIARNLIFAKNGEELSKILMLYCSQEEELIYKTLLSTTKEQLMSETDLKLSMRNSKLKRQETKFSDQISQEEYSKINSFRELLPFTFNISEFYPTKDPLGNELIILSNNFNQSLRVLRDNVKEIIFQLSGNCSKPSNMPHVIFSESELKNLNDKYSSLKIALKKANIFNDNLNKTVQTENNLILGNVMRLNVAFTSKKVLEILKAKTAKKQKEQLNNFKIIWQICSPELNLEDLGCKQESSLIIEGQILKFNEFYDKMVHNKQKLSLIASAITVQTEKQVRSGLQLFQIPVLSSKNELLGKLLMKKEELEIRSPEILKMHQIRLNYNGIELI